MRVIFLLPILLAAFLTHPPGFTRFDYTSEKAKPSGRLNLHDLGSLDKMNPYTLKGLPADRLTSYMFETLTMPSQDEPFAEYGLIARDIEVAEDGLFVTFTLNERAAFSDGAPVTPEDVKFSLETLKGEAACKEQHG